MLYENVGDQVFVDWRVLTSTQHVSREYPERGRKYSWRREKKVSQLTLGKFAKLALATTAIYGAST